MELQVQRATLQDKSILRHLLELYQYDLSAVENRDVDANGLYGYEYLDHYWTEPRRHPFLVRVDCQIAGFVLVFAGYLAVIYVFLTNSHASRIIEVEEGQKVITTGPYALVRHPMYLATCILYAATPIALGSWWTLIPIMFIAMGFIVRIKDEEEELIANLPGYREYMQKTRSRLIPGIW